MRRSERPPPEPEYEYDTTITDTRDRGRRFEAKTSKNDRVWTEITKDLISEESIKEVGYEYEQNEKFYYVMEFLHYVSRSFPPLSSKIKLLLADA